MKNGFLANIVPYWPWRETLLLRIVPLVWLSLVLLMIAFAIKARMASRWQKSWSDCFAEGEDRARRLCEAVMRSIRRQRQRSHRMRRRIAVA